MGNISLIISIIIGIITILGFILAAHKWVIKQELHDKEQDKKFDSFKENINERIDIMNVENQVICYGLLACLDGLKQLGANGNVTKAHDKLEKHLNDRAHQ